MIFEWIIDSIFSHSFPLEWRIDSNIYTAHKFDTFCSKKINAEKIYFYSLLIPALSTEYTHCFVRCLARHFNRHGKLSFEWQKIPPNRCVLVVSLLTIFWYNGFNAETLTDTETQSLNWKLQYVEHDKALQSILRLVYTLLCFLHFCVPKFTIRNAINIHAKQLNSRQSSIIVSRKYTSNT